MFGNQSASLGLIGSLAASLCCITPLAAAIGGLSGVASSFCGIEPARPYLLGGSVWLLAGAWWRMLRPQKSDACGCALPGKRTMPPSTGLLTVVTVLSVLLLAFPLYPYLLYANRQPLGVTVPAPVTSSKQVAFVVKAVGCASCEPQVEIAVAKLSGIHRVKASAAKKNTVVQFDPAKTNIEAIRDAINSTGYTVKNLTP